MTDAQLGALRRHYHALRQMRSVLEPRRELPHYVLEPDTVRRVGDELARLDAAFPGLVPPLEMDRLPGNRGEWYRPEPVLMHVNQVLGILEAELESVTSSAPVVGARAFAFIADAELRAILERDDLEIRRAFVMGHWKSVLVLSGGAIEAILLDRLRPHEVRAKAATAAPTGGARTDLTRWDLNDLINVCLELKVVAPSVGALTQASRAYRNLVHPGAEIRTQLKFGGEEARIAVTVLDILHRDSSP